mgnify:CR=1 FL=1
MSQVIRLSRVRLVTAAVFSATALKLNDQCTGSCKNLIQVQSKKAELHHTVQVKVLMH